MKVLCLAADRHLAYLIKHVLAFEGYAVEVCRSLESALEGVLEGASILVTAEPLPAPAAVAAPVVVAGTQMEPVALLRAVRAAAERPRP